MILDIRKLKRSGKDQTDFFFEYTPVDFDLDIPSAEFDGAVKVNGRLTLIGEHACLVEGEINFTIKGACTRCLEDASNSYLVEFAENVEEDNEDGYSLKNDTVDLALIVDDYLAMNIPVSFLCKDDCKGLCAGCGTNLNNGECKCKN